MPLASCDAAAAPVGEALLPVACEPTEPAELIEPFELTPDGVLVTAAPGGLASPGATLLALPCVPIEPAELGAPLAPIVEPEPLMPDALVPPFLVRLPSLASPLPDVDAVPVLAVRLPVLELLAELAVEAPMPCDDVVVALGDFLSLFMSPRARAEPLVRATIDVRMNAGASLRIWTSKVECG